MKTNQYLRIGLQANWDEKYLTQMRQLNASPHF